jgi:hypothetical protein
MGPLLAYRAFAALRLTWLPIPLLFCGRFLLQSVALGLIHGRQVDHELGELGRIARTFGAFSWHGASMRRTPSRCQRPLALPYSKEPSTPPPNPALPFGRGRSVMMSSDSACAPQTWQCRKRLSLLMRASDGSMSARGCNPALLCRRGYPHMHWRRSPINGARLPSVAVRIFSSFMTAGAGSITTARQSSSTGYARPFA